MREKLKILYPIIVEGKYDKIKLASLVDGVIITCGGFGIFKDTEKRALLRALARERELIVLSDSDSAGALIRTHLSGIIPKERLINLYTPQLKGKEKRKRAPSKEGYLGVEGTDADLLYSLLLPYSTQSAPPKRGDITKTDLYILGLSGGADSAKLRDETAKRLSLPAGMTANALLEAVNMICTRETLTAAVEAAKS